MKTLNQIASMIAKYEGKKSETSIGNIREILKILVYLEYSGHNVISDLKGMADAKKPVETKKKTATKKTKVQIKNVKSK